jgi:AcrR family transcriptional regulator
LYWYFRSKDDLLAALVDEVTREMFFRLAPMGPGPWDEEIVEYHVAFRGLLEESPVYREIFAFRAQALFLRSRMAPALLRNIEDDLAVFVRAGLTPDEAADAFNAFSVYTRAFVLVEHRLDQDRLDDTALPLLNYLLKEMSADTPSASSLPGLEVVLRLDDEVFRFGLQLLVAGLCDRYPSLRKSVSAEIADTHLVDEESV